jgi:peptidylprolyl isomerase
MKLPPGVPAVKGVIKTAFSLRYQDTKIGAGPVAEPNKMYKVHYTGWLAADGRKFDSSYDHPRQPLKDKDGKPVMDADGKPKLDDPQPISFPQGFGRVIPGWDQGFEGMKVGGKRRIFIPWQLAYGARGRLTGDPKNPGIPPKADLIFDVELVAIDELPTPPQRPGMGGVPPGARPMPGANPPHPPVNGQPNAAPAPAASGSPAAPATPATPGAPAAPGATPAPAKPAAPATPAPTPAPAAPPAQGTPATPATPPQPH